MRLSYRSPEEKSVQGTSALMEINDPQDPTVQLRIPVPDPISVCEAMVVTVHIVVGQKDRRHE